MYYVAVPYIVTSQLATFTCVSVHLGPLCISLSLFLCQRSQRVIPSCQITHKSTEREITHSSCHLLSDACCSQRQQSVHDFHVTIVLCFLQFYNYKRLILKLKAVSMLSYTFCILIYDLSLGRDNKKLAAVHSLVRQKACN